ncbi:hypothetical protein AYI68_g3724 [Smittium mucronatum]|uniref:CST complex subunit CTC1 n=1 Tax=Smittium mucronatum TaxID=133383 RepID=A0A1R0GZ21_9FUNG|nr:hypothetical protein AYI68_g3724 [Smittium mucronatum]
MDPILDSFMSLLNYNYYEVIYNHSINKPSNITPKYIPSSNSLSNFYPYQRFGESSKEILSSNKSESDFDSIQPFQSQNNHQPTPIDSSNYDGNVSYTGTITKIIDSRLGLFTLDDCVILSVGFCEDFNPWIPLRNMTKIKINNVHPFSLPHPGSYCDNNMSFNYKWEIDRRLSQGNGCSIVLLGVEKTSIEVLGQHHNSPVSDFSPNLPNDETLFNIFNRLKLFSKIQTKFEVQSHSMEDNLDPKVYCVDVYSTSLSILNLDSFSESNPKKNFIPHIDTGLGGIQLCGILTLDKHGNTFLSDSSFQIPILIVSSIGNLTLDDNEPKTHKRQKLGFHIKSRFSDAENIGVQSPGSSIDQYVNEFSDSLNISQMLGHVWIFESYYVSTKSSINQKNRFKNFEPLTESEICIVSTFRNSKLIKSKPSNDFLKIEKTSGESYSLDKNIFQNLIYLVPISPPNKLSAYSELNVELDDNDKSEKSEIVSFMAYSAEFLIDKNLHLGIDLILDSESFLKHCLATNSSSSFLRYSNIGKFELTFQDKELSVDHNNSCTNEDVLISSKKFFEQISLESSRSSNQMDSICLGYKNNDVVSINGILENVLLSGEKVKLNSEKNSSFSAGNSEVLFSSLNEFQTAKSQIETNDHSRSNSSEIVVVILKI